MTETASMAATHDADIHRHVRGYLIVFAALLLLTLVTVAVSYLHLPSHQAIAVAMVIAVIKASLVAAFFMHLISERQIIYALLGFAALCFAGMIGLTFLGWYDQVRLW